MTRLKLTQTQKQMLYALGKFYEALNQPLVEKPVTLQTSKKTFIDLLLQSDIFPKKERAIYSNLETLEKKDCLAYQHHLVKFTDKGLQELQKIEREIEKILFLKTSFVQPGKKIKTLQTLIKN